MTAALVVANPTSGGGRGARLIPRVISELRALGVDHRMVVARDGQEPARAAARAVQDGVPAVIALGGDGLAGSVAGPLVGSDTALAIVPAGNGNDIARALGLDLRRPLRSLRLLAEGRRRPVDAARAEGPGWARHYLGVAGAGFDSETNAYANTITRLRGTPRYVVAVFRTLATFRPAELVVRVDGEETRESAMLAAVANGPCYGGGMRVAPDAAIDDGALDVCIVGAMSRRAFVTAFPKVFTGRHVRHPAVRILRGSKVELDASRPFDVYGDGERFGPLPATFTVLPAALTAVAP